MIHQCWRFQIMQLGILFLEQDEMVEVHKDRIDLAV
jgi:hypothetical protein